MVRMATMGGAQALGMDDLIGSLEVGKRADVIVVDIDQPQLTPMYHPASHLVYAVRAGDVRHVMVEGEWVVRERRLLNINLDDLLQRVRVFARMVVRSR